MKIILYLIFSISILFCDIQKNTITIAIENEEERLNPVFSEDHDSAISLIFTGLLRYEDAKIVPDLAKSYHISDDGLCYEFELRDDVTWHDGAHFSADDVKFTIDTLKDERLNSSIKTNYNAISKVKIINKYKIKIILNTPYPALLDALTIGILPKHILENKDINTSDFNKSPIGTGPFKLKKWIKGQYKILKANKNFYLGEVKSDTLILKIIKDNAKSVLELKNDNLDAALISFDFIQNFKNNNNFNILIGKAVDYRALMFNMQNPILNDINVRLALNYAIDKKAIIQKILNNLGEIAHHPLQRTWADPIIYNKFEYNPQKTQELLYKAGYTKNKNGKYEKNGKLLSFDIYTFNSDYTRVMLVNYLVSEFNKLGISARGFAKTEGSFDYTKVDSFLVGWGSFSDPDFHTFKVFGSIENDFNFGHFKDKIVNENLLKARQSNFIKDRKQYYANFINALYNNPPFLFLVYLDYALVYNKNLKNVKINILGHHGIGFAYDAWKWSKE